MICAALGAQFHTNLGQLVMIMQPVNLAKQFAEAVAAQDFEIAHGDAGRGNEFAKKYIEAAKQLLEPGAPGIEASASLFQEEDALVTAAYYLLPFKTEESLKVLEAAAKGKGVSALNAFIILARWKGGERGLWDALANDIHNGP